MSDGVVVRVLGSFALVNGDVFVSLPAGATQLVAFLALHPGPWRRMYVAGQIWPDFSERRARANLRNAIWRLDTEVPGVVHRDSDQLRLASGVRSDLSEARALADALIGDEPTSLKVGPGCARLISGELLPDRYEDWVIFERARLKQLFLHALERLAVVFADQGRWAEALDAGLSAVAMEPLRETAHRTLVRIHAAEGNFSEARRQYEEYRTLLLRHLGALPSKDFTREADALLVVARPELRRSASVPVG